MKLGFWKIWRELFDAACKALLIVALFSSLKFGIFFSTSHLGKGIADAFVGSLLMHGIGFILFLPVIFLLSLLVGAPISYALLNKRENNIYELAFTGMIVSFLFLYIPFLFTKNGFDFYSFLSGGIDYALGGALTGVFFYKNIASNTKAESLEMVIPPRTRTFHDELGG